MDLTRRVLLTGAAALAAPAIVRAQGNPPIRIGEINSYTAIPSFTLPYRNGWQLAVEQVNAAGGVLGRKLEVDQPRRCRQAAGCGAPRRRTARTSRRSICWPARYLSNVGLAVSRLRAAATRSCSSPASR